ncbi:tRNA wybutosine-synthesizing protein 2/3/4 [Ananas comosus]|uniref:tRNA(Phe) 7-[(3-amino-3-carboxypropyl)-4-demethylwyosine(37)-N(4)]-methyltransferase n=1 Tax=Ananas comosus TaxID=4615 RepID=A0A199UHY4_ANACO|nr:tRNA wybutosine-synthesizing protein 2/3/4 [Ananas comosus]
MEFEKRKAAAMAALSAAGPDKSPKGGVDAAIAPLLAAINRHPALFTTSSCSGRISILSHPIPNPNPNPNPDPDGAKEKTTKKKKTKAGGGGWVFVSHDPADPDAVVDILFTNPSVEGGRRRRRRKRSCA